MYVFGAFPGLTRILGVNPEYCTDSSYLRIIMRLCKYTLDEKFACMAVDKYLAV